MRPTTLPQGSTTVATSISPPTFSGVSCGSAPFLTSNCKFHLYLRLPSIQLHYPLVFQGFD